MLIIVGNHCTDVQNYNIKSSGILNMYVFKRYKWLLFLSSEVSKIQKNKIGYTKLKANNNSSFKIYLTKCKWLYLMKRPIGRFIKYNHLQLFIQLSWMIDPQALMSLFWNQLLEMFILRTTAHRCPFASRRTLYMFHRLIAWWDQSYPCTTSFVIWLKSV